METHGNAWKFDANLTRMDHQNGLHASGANVSSGEGFELGLESPFGSTFGVTFIGVTPHLGIVQVPTKSFSHMEPVSGPESGHLAANALQAVLSHVGHESPDQLCHRPSWMEGWLQGRLDLRALRAVCKAMRAVADTAVTRIELPALVSSRQAAKELCRTIPVFPRLGQLTLYGSLDRTLTYNWVATAPGFGSRALLPNIVRLELHEVRMNAAEAAALASLLPNLKAVDICTLWTCTVLSAAYLARPGILLRLAVRGSAFLRDAMIPCPGMIDEGFGCWSDEQLACVRELRCDKFCPNPITMVLSASDMRVLSRMTALRRLVLGTCLPHEGPGVEVLPAGLRRLSCGWSVPSARRLRLVPPGFAPRWERAACIRQELWMMVDSSEFQEAVREAAAALARLLPPGADFPVMYLCVKTASTVMLGVRRVADAMAPVLADAGLGLDMEVGQLAPPDAQVEEAGACERIAALFTQRGVRRAAVTWHGKTPMDEASLTARRPEPDPDSWLAE
jgi:hypothetical protein